MKMALPQGSGRRSDNVPAVGAEDLAFYVGWPKGWAVFRLAKDVWKEETVGEDAKAAHVAQMVFPIGAPNDGFA